MTLCSSCRHHIESALGAAFDQCGRKELCVSYPLIRGDKPAKAYCIDMRYPGAECGLNAKLFEEKT